MQDRVAHYLNGKKVEAVNNVSFVNEWFEIKTDSYGAIFMTNRVLLQRFYSKTG